MKNHNFSLTNDYATATGQPQARGQSLVIDRGKRTEASYGHRRSVTRPLKGAR